MKRIFVFIGFITATVLPARSQNLFDEMREHNIFQHLDAAVSLGTTGIGVDVSSPIGDYVQLRAGFDFMPHIHHTMHFGVQVGETRDDTKFNRLADMMEDLTGIRVDPQVDMIGMPTYNNFKLLVDVFPIKNDKRWHVTAGFYAGPSTIGKAYNATADMPSLMGVGIYNNLYEKAINYEPFVTVDMNGARFYFTDDPEMQDILYDKFMSYGRMGVQLGYYTSDIYDAEGNLLHAKGSAYMMEPNENSMAKARVKVNSFKPYLGVGYGGRLLRHSDEWHVAVDLGALFWGGTPSIITHDGTDLAHDVSNIRGKVGDYVDVIKTFKVFPVLNVRLVKTIF